MRLYILDTDHLSLNQRNPTLFARYLKQIPSEQIAITIITAQEQLRGRFLQINAARTEEQAIAAYQQLQKTIRWLNDYQVIDYDFAASRVYTNLRQQKIRIGTQDLRIAAITLSVGGILVTRNQIDFGQIPALTIEDWTK